MKRASTSTDHPRKRRKIAAGDKSSGVSFTEEEKILMGEQNSSISGRKGSVYRPPTGEEMTSLRETEGLFHSNLFRLQIDELLAEVRPKAKYPSLDKFLYQLREFLLGLPGTDEFKLCDEASWLPSGTCLPLPKEIIGQATSDCKFRFLPPSSVKVVGSYLLGTATKPSLNVNIAVQISSELLYPSDYLNHRYLHKRAAFLALLASHLCSWDSVNTVQFARANGNPLLPILVLKPAGKAGRHFRVNIHPCVEEGFFRMSRLGPRRNCLRFHKLYGGKTLDTNEEVPTAYYNTAVLRDMAMLRHLCLLHASVQQCPAMADAVHLFSVWLHQRHLDEGQHAFSHFLASMVVTQLLQTRQVTPLTSSYQILRLLFRTIGSGDWTKKGLSLYQGDDDVPKLGEYADMFEVVFVDDSGYLNLCAHMTTASYLELVHEARLAMEFLDDSALDAFEALFMTPVEAALKFDQLSHLSNVCPLQSSSVEWQRRCLAEGGDWLTGGLRYICRVLRRGLGQRVNLLAHNCRAKETWEVSEEACPLSQTEVSFGFLINTESAYAVIDHGPAANSDEALSFRKFWGAKSELRLFQDSSILEAVLWPSTCAAEKRTIIARIVSHLLQRHAQLPPSSICHHVGPFNSFLRAAQVKLAVDSASVDDQLDITDDTIVPKHSEQAKHLLAMEKAKQQEKKPLTQTDTLPTGEEEHATVISLLDELGRRLRGLSDLPLSIVSVQGASPVFRNTEVYPCRRVLRMKGSKSLAVAKDDPSSTSKWHSSVLVPSIGRCPPWTPVLQVVCQLESSGKWPDDLAAISRVKAAFYLRLASLLEEHFSLTAVPTSKAVFIVMNEAVFELVIFHKHEADLAELAVRQLSKGNAGFEPVDMCGSELIQWTAQLHRDTIACPLHTSHMHSVSQQYSAFGPTCRLAKRWLASHLLSPHFTEESVELIVAHIFLTPAPFEPPASASCGFLRFVHLLSSWDWAGKPLVVNLNNDMKDEDESEILPFFKSHRTQLPAAVIVTPSDLRSSLWTAQKPSQVVLHRACLLAREALSVLKTSLMSREENSSHVVFLPSLDDYHVLIHLHTHQLPRRYQAIAASCTELHAKPVSAHQQLLPVMSYEPVQCYLQTLEAVYGHAAMFFYDEFGGSVIGVVWKDLAASAFQVGPYSLTRAILTGQTSQLRVSSINGCKPCRVPKPKKKKVQNDLVQFNVEAALDNFIVLGRGLVKRVQKVVST